MLCAPEPGPIPARDVATGSCKQHSRRDSSSRGNALGAAMSPGSHNEVMATVLIELPGGEGIVRRDDGEIVLAHDVTLDSGQPLQPWDRYQPIRIGLSDDRMLFGGLLPPGAVSVEAVEAYGRPPRSAAAPYAVVFEDREHSEPALGYRDVAGAFVHRPMPAEYPHQPVSDAEEPCPVCGAVQYD